MAEILWALFLFPDNIGVETKRCNRDGLELVRGAIGPFASDAF
jgi:hypothetical protein